MVSRTFQAIVHSALRTAIVSFVVSKIIGIHLAVYDVLTIFEVFVLANVIFFDFMGYGYIDNNEDESSGEN